MSWISDNRTLLIIVAVIVLAVLVLRTRPTALPDDGITSLVNGGSPVVIEVYSNT